MKTSIFALGFFWILLSAVQLHAVESEDITLQQINWSDIPNSFKFKVECRGGMKSLARLSSEPGYNNRPEVTHVICAGLRTEIVSTYSRSGINLKCGGAPDGVATKVVAVEGKDYCIVSNAFRHPPDCKGKFKQGAKGRLMIQQGEDYCVSGNKRFRPDCQGKNYVHELQIDEQAHQDFCLPRPLRLGCQDRTTDHSPVKILQLEYRVDQNSTFRDVCYVQYLELASPTGFTR